MIFEIEARAGEKVDLRKALREDLKVSMIPLTKGSANSYGKLNIASILNTKDEGVVKALVIVQNMKIADKVLDGTRYVSWDLIEGMRFYSEIPVDIYEDIYVVPASSVVNSGPDKVILVREGKQFSERKVVVLHSNNEVAILSKESDFVAGEPVVVKGAFEVQQAIQAGGKQAIDPHAGHSH